MTRPHVLLVGKDATYRARIHDVVAREGALATGASSDAEAFDAVRRDGVEMVVIVDDPPATDARRFLDQCASLPRPPLVAVVNPSGSALDLVRAGAFDAVPLNDHSVEPLRTAVLRLRRARDQRARLERACDELQRWGAEIGLVGWSRAIVRLRDELGRIARSTTPVWLHGEAGSGRKTTARGLHRRRGDDHPFLVVECSAPASAGEQAFERFVEQARGGTLVLEEPTALSHDSQQRVAALIESTVDVRWVGVSLCSPTAAVEDGLLLPALAKKLGETRLEIPALRHRIEDVPFLAAHVVETIRSLNEMPPLHIDAEVLAVLSRQRWPGNVRELRETLERAVILARDGRVSVECLPDGFRAADASSGRGTAVDVDAASFRDAKRDVVEEFERAYLGRLMAKHRGNVTAAARTAGMLRSALQRLLRKHGLRSAQFRKGPGASIATRDGRHSSQTPGVG